MIRLHQSFFCLVAATAIFSAQAQNPLPLAGKVSAAPQNLVPLPPRSPVNFFRSLLAMRPAERAGFLTNRPPEIRARILAKVQEYQNLDPNERELRLCATDLRWYLMPLLQLSPTNRSERLAQVPDNLRPLIKDRLVRWDILPPPLQQEFLDNDRALHYFTSVEMASQVDINPQHAAIADQFNQFFELTADEKQKTLNTLSAAERAQMEKTLRSFGQLPEEQRLQCIQNYAKFAGMSAADRAEFLKNATRWSQMSPEERQTWRDLVDHVPQWPPLPPGVIPANLYPPGFPKIPGPGVATN